MQHVKKIYFADLTKIGRIFIHLHQTTNIVLAVVIYLFYLLI